MKQDPDLEIVEQVQNGDKYAFELLYLKYHRKISRLLASMLSHQSDLDDALQETFIKAYRALPKFKKKSNFYTWLYRIAINTAHTYNRRRQRSGEKPLEDQESPGDSTSPFAHSKETPETVHDQRQIMETIQKSICQLSDDQRRTLILREVEGLSYDEIAKVMNCSPGTVRSRLHRAREAVAKELAPIVQE